MTERNPNTQPLPATHLEMAQLAFENEKLRRKQRKIQQRRDHYAKLYYRAQADLDERNWELAIAKSKIRDLRAQVAANFITQGPSNNVPYYSSRSEILSSSSTSRSHKYHQHPSIHHRPHHDHPPPPPHSHNVHPPHPHYHPPPPHGSQNLTQSAPCSVPMTTAQRNLTHGSESDSTSPDSGASFSPGIEPPCHAHFSQVSQVSQRSNTLPSTQYPSNRGPYRESTGHVGVERGREQEVPRSKTERHDRQREEGSNNQHQVEAEERSVQWKRESKGVEFSPHDREDDVTGALRNQISQEKWAKAVSHPTNRALLEKKGAETRVAEEDKPTNSPIPFQNTRPPPEVLASPIATHRRHPSFEPKLTPSASYSLSQGEAVHSPLLPSSRRIPVQSRQQQLSFSLSQDANISSPLYLHKPTFNHGAMPRRRGGRTLSSGQVPLQHVQSPLDSVAPFQDELFSDSELEQESKGSAFRRPPPSRQLSLPINPLSSRQKASPESAEGTHPPPPPPPPSSHHALRHPPTSHLSHLHSPPTSHSHHPLPHPGVQGGHSHPPHHPPHPHSSHRHTLPYPTVPPPPLPLQYTRHTERTSTTGHTTVDHHDNSKSHTQPTEVAVATEPRSFRSSERGVIRVSAASYKTDVLGGGMQKAEKERKEEEKETEEEEDEEEKDEVANEKEEEAEEEGERVRERPGEFCCARLSGGSFFELLTRISNPACTIKKLEIADCNLGKPQGMAVLCCDLRKNRSIQELSLPNNGIGAESLQLLLDCVQQCHSIKELQLRGNNIGRRCAPILKAFLEKTSLDSLVLTGNEIEQCGELLNRTLPSDFTMEYDAAEGSVDSGVVVAEGDHQPQYLNV